MTLNSKVFNVGGSLRLLFVMTFSVSFSIVVSGLFSASLILLFRSRLWQFLFCFVLFVTHFGISNFASIRFRLRPSRDWKCRSKAVWDVKSNETSEFNKKFGNLNLVSFHFGGLFSYRFTSVWFSAILVLYRSLSVLKLFFSYSFMISDKFDGSITSWTAKVPASARVRMIHGGQFLAEWY